MQDHLLRCNPVFKIEVFSFTFPLILLLKSRIPAEPIKAASGLIQDDQYKLYKAGLYSDTPVLVGYNSDEGATFPGARTPEACAEGLEALDAYFEWRRTAVADADAGGALPGSAHEK